MMAYQQRPSGLPPPPYHPISHTIPLSPKDGERKHAAWDPVPRPYPSMASPSLAYHPFVPNLWEPESDSSTVSDTGEDYHSRMLACTPTTLPSPISKTALESQDAIASRLRELSRVEDSNVRKLDILRAKRARKDERIRQKRDAQDLKIKAIMEARARRDDRIMRRRRMEDEAFERVDQELEEEETNLRRRMKRLKRGLPLEEIMNHDRSYSSASMSPPGSSFNGIPPAKRHQSGPPGQNDSPISSTGRLPSQPATLPLSTPLSSSQVPSYSFLHSSHPPPPPPPPSTTMSSGPGGAPSPYGRSPTYTHAHSPLSRHAQSYAHPPPPPPPPVPPPPTSHPAPSSESLQYRVNGNQPGPHPSGSAVLPNPANPNIVAQAVQPPLPPPPPRHSTSTYDTRPPPPSVAPGFAPVNQPSATGFAAINPRETGTPPSQHATPGRDAASLSSRAAEYDRIYGLSRPSAESTPNSATSGTPVPTGKRAPSTTHPYQMSEAFANRHHHCEKEDSLRRGIWTYYGPGGTQDKPTEPPTEMYLRCNHGDCKRIDWRTVHGLQCHIVKNHEQPKGTIGSLEKALDRYGIPVSEIQAYEKEHGEGTGGTMADPKNLKLKAKSRDSSDRAEQKKWVDSTISHPPHSTYRDNIAMSLGEARYPVVSRPPVPSVPSNGHYTPPELKPNVSHVQMQAQIPARLAGGFAAVNGSWASSNAVPPTENKDVEMKDGPSAEAVGNDYKADAPRPSEPTWQLKPPETSRPASASLQNMTRQAASSIVPIDPTPQSTADDHLEGSSQAANADETSGPSQHVPGQPGPSSPQVLPIKVDAEPETVPNVPSQQSGSFAEQAPHIEEGAATTADEINAGDIDDAPKDRPRTPDGVQSSETDKEISRTKPEHEEGRRSALTSPDGSVRRTSWTARRGSSRRPSLAASRAVERERELSKAREREEEMNTAADPTDRSDTIVVDTEPTKEHASKARDEKEEEANDGDAGDSITVATTPGPSARERKERERDDVGGRTSKRLTAGRLAARKSR